MTDALAIDNPADALAMTHQAEGPNPVPQALQSAAGAGMNFASGGLQRALGLPNSAVGRVLQNPDNELAMGMARFIPRYKPYPMNRELPQPTAPKVAGHEEIVERKPRGPAVPPGSAPDYLSRKMKRVMAQSSQEPETDALLQQFMKLFSAKEK